jgi:hypothetical protein
MSPTYLSPALQDQASTSGGNHSSPDCRTVDIYIRPLSIWVVISSSTDAC